MDLGFAFCHPIQVCGGTQDKIFSFKRRRAAHPSEGNIASAGDRERGDVAASPELHKPLTPPLLPPPPLRKIHTKPSVRSVCAVIKLGSTP